MPDDRPVSPIDAARQGCAVCGGALRVPPAGDPFSDGPYKGRYLCKECWTLHYDLHPNWLADEESRRYVAEEAKKIRIRRAHEARLKERHAITVGNDAEVVFEEGESRVFLTDRGMLLFSIACSEHFSPDEYDPERFWILLRAVEALKAKVPKYSPSNA